MRSQKQQDQRRARYAEYGERSGGIRTPACGGLAVQSEDRGARPAAGRAGHTVMRLPGAGLRDRPVQEVDVGAVGGEHPCGQK